MAKIVLDGITKYYGKTGAVENANLTIEDGEFRVLVGPSGSGKTTLLNIIVGLERATSGHIYFNDQVVDDVLPENRDIAMVFQNIALYPTLKIFDNIAFPLVLRRMPKSEIIQAVGDVASQFGISQHLTKYPHQLSGGERQRVAIARAVVRKPVAFLFDEPLSNLDAKLRVEMRTEIKRLHQQIGTTFIYITHDQEEALSLADRITIVNQGKLVQTASPTDVYLYPVDTFVAGFVGSPAMNILPAYIERGSQETLMCKGDGLSVYLPQSYTPNLVNYIGQRILLGIRPEHISLFTKNSDDEQRISATIEVIQLMGRESHVTVRLEGGIEALRVISSRGDLQSGQPCWIYISGSDTRIFDIESKRALINRDGVLL